MEDIQVITRVSPTSMTEAEVEISESDKGVEEPNLISEPPTSNGGVNDESEAGNLIDEEEETGPELVHNIHVFQVA